MCTFILDPNMHICDLIATATSDHAKLLPAAIQGGSIDGGHTQ